MSSPADASIEHLKAIALIRPVWAIELICMHRLAYCGICDFPEKPTCRYISNAISLWLAGNWKEVNLFKK